MHEIIESIRKSISSNTIHTHMYIYIYTSVWNPFWNYPPSAPYVGSDSPIPSRSLHTFNGGPFGRYSDIDKWSIKTYTGSKIDIAPFHDIYLFHDLLVCSEEGGDEEPCVCHSLNKKVRGQLAGACAMWTPGIKLRGSGLAASTLTDWAISLAQASCCLSSCYQ